MKIDKHVALFSEFSRNDQNKFQKIFISHKIKKRPKIQSLTVYVFLNITIRLPALITLRYFHFLQDRQGAQ